MENLNYVIHLFHSGGYVMYPLLFLSLMVIAIAVERTFYYRKYAGKTYIVTHAVNEYAKLQKWDEIEKVIKENPSIASRIAEAGLKNGATEEGMKTAFSDQMGVDAVGFRKYMDYLSATVTISPLLGLLGTVTGMIGSLCVAIMAFIVYTFFSHRLDSIINQIENMCVNIITAKREGWK